MRLSKTVIRTQSINLFNTYIKTLPELHPEYDLSNVVLKSKKHKVDVICGNHGMFSMRLDSLVDGRKCPKCARLTAASKTVEKLRKPLQTFITEAEGVHKKTYSYKNVDYKSTDTKVKIICKIHGEFEQTPARHLKGQGCALCGRKTAGINGRTKQSDFISAAVGKHASKYSYEKVAYITTDTKVCITCKEHGYFLQTPHSHLNGIGCPNCAKYGFSSKLGASLYYVKLVNNFGGSAYKVGVTKHSNVLDRFTPRDKKLVKAILYTEWFVCGLDALEKEQKILKKCSKFLYKGLPILDSGNTEVFYKNILTELLPEA